MQEATDASSALCEARAGACRQFIARKRRYCSNMASSESDAGFCTLHMAQALQDVDLDAGIHTTDGAESKKKKNLTRCTDEAPLPVPTKSPIINP